MPLYLPMSSSVAFWAQTQNLMTYLSLTEAGTIWSLPDALMVDNSFWFSSSEPRSLKQTNPSYIKRKKIGMKFDLRIQTWNYVKYYYWHFFSWFLRFTSMNMPLTKSHYVLITSCLINEGWNRIFFHETSTYVLDYISWNQLLLQSDFRLEFWPEFLNNSAAAICFWSKVRNIKCRKMKKRPEIKSLTSF